MTGAAVRTFTRPARQWPNRPNINAPASEIPTLCVPNHALRSAGLVFGVVGIGGSFAGTALNRQIDGHSPPSKPSPRRTAAHAIATAGVGLTALAASLRDRPGWISK